MVDAAQWIEKIKEEIKFDVVSTYIRTEEERMELVLTDKGKKSDFCYFISVDDGQPDPGRVAEFFNREMENMKNGS